MRGDAWACFADTWPDVAESGFDVDGWVRLGEIPDTEAAFWKACGLQHNGGARSAWKQTVGFYVHVYADSPALRRLNGDLRSAEPFWLGLQPFTGTSRLYVSAAKVARADQERHEPERHPGLLPVPHETLGLKLVLTDDGIYFEVGRS